MNDMSQYEINEVLDRMVFAIREIVRDVTGDEEESFDDFALLLAFASESGRVALSTSLEPAQAKEIFQGMIEDGFSDCSDWDVVDVD